MSMRGVGYFTVYRYFEKWDWLIGASLLTTTMFQQRQTYLVIVGWASLAVFIGLRWRCRMWWGAG